MDKYKDTAYPCGVASPCRPEARTWKGEDLATVRRQGVPRVVVLDNASSHRARAIRKVRADLVKAHLHLWYLLPMARS